MSSSCTNTPRNSNSDEDTLAQENLTDLEDDDEVFDEDQAIPKVFITPTIRQDHIKGGYAGTNKLSVRGGDKKYHYFGVVVILCTGLIY